MKYYKSQMIGEKLENYEIERPILNSNKNIQYIIQNNDIYYIASKKLLNEEEIKSFDLNEYEFKPLQF